MSAHCLRNCLGSSFSILFRVYPGLLTPTYTVDSAFSDLKSADLHCQSGFSDLKSPDLHCRSGISDLKSLDLHCRSGFSDLKSPDLHCQSGFPDLKSPDLHCRFGFPDLKNADLHCQSGFPDLKSPDLHCRWGGDSEFISGPKGRPYVCSSSSRRSSQSCPSRQGIYEKSLALDEMSGEALLFRFVAERFLLLSGQSTLHLLHVFGRGQISGTIPRSIIIWRTAALLSTCSRLISDTP